MSSKNPYFHVSDNDYKIISELDVNRHTKEQLLEKIHAANARIKRIAELTEKGEERARRRVSDLSSWQKFVVNDKSRYEDEEAFRTDTINGLGKPLELQPLGSAAQWTVLQQNLKMEDRTMMYRNGMTKFTPMAQLDKSTPKPSAPNLLKLDDIMTSYTLKGSYVSAKAGSGKTTAFTALFPVMAAELALNWRHLWWTYPSGQAIPKHIVFNKANKDKYPIREQRVFFIDEAEALQGYGSSLVGDVSLAYTTFRNVIRTNPNRIMFVVDEIADFLAPGTGEAAQSSGRQIGGPKSFINFIKTTISGTASGPYKYKFFGLFATENLGNFIEQGDRAGSFYNQQIQNRLGQVMTFDEITWDEEKLVTRWLKESVGYLAKDVEGYRAPDLSKLPTAMQEKEKENLDKFYNYVIKKAKAIFYNKDIADDDALQPSVQRSLGTTMGVITENYLKSRIDAPDYQKFLFLKSELYTLKTNKRLYEEDLEDLQAQLAATRQASAAWGIKTAADESDPDEDGSDANATPSVKVTPAVQSPADDISGYFGEISSREDSEESADRREIEESNPLEEQIERIRQDLASTERDIAVKEKKLEMLIADLRHELTQPKVDDKIGSVDGDFIAEDLRDYDFFKITDMVETPASQIRKTAVAKEQAIRDARKIKKIKYEQMYQDEQKAADAKMAPPETK